MRGGIRRATRTRAVLGEDALRAAGDEREAFVERAALALLRKAAFVGGLEEEQEHAYIESALSDLRGRLHGWPPEPPSPNWSAHFDRLLHLAESGAVGTLVDKHVFHLAGACDTTSPLRGGRLRLRA